MKNFAEILARASGHVVAAIGPDRAPEDALGFVLFVSDGSCQFGFAAGDNPAGQLYISVRLDQELLPYGELLYDTY
jgi:hypothetical protein